MLRVETDQKVKPIFCDWFKKLHGVEFKPDDVTTFAQTDFDPETGKVEILSVAILHNWTVSAVEVTVGSDGTKRQKNSKEMIHLIYDFVFNQAKRTCLQCHIGVENEKSIVLCEKMGCTRIAAVPSYYGDGKDAWLYTITKKDWLFSINSPIKAISTTVH